LYEKHGIGGLGTGIVRGGNGRATPGNRWAGIVRFGEGRERPGSG
jgi:hypothetical protein